MRVDTAVLPLWTKIVFHPLSVTELKGRHMKIPKGAVVAVADGEVLNLFRNVGDEAAPKLDAMPDRDVTTANAGSGGRHQSSSANPSGKQQTEDNFAAGVADVLNKGVLSGKFDHVIVIAAPRTLGELRKHYHKELASILIGEISKDLTGHTIEQLESTITAA